MEKYCEYGHGNLLEWLFKGSFLLSYIIESKSGFLLSFIIAMLGVVVKVGFGELRGIFLGSWWNAKGKSLEMRWIYVQDSG